MPDTNVVASQTSRRLGVLVVGLGGAVASTAAAGVELLRSGSNDLAGLPLANIGVSGLAQYRNMHFAGWDVRDDDLASAVREHRVLDRDQTDQVEHSPFAIAALARSRQPRLLPQHSR